MVMNYVKKSLIKILERKGFYLYTKKRFPLGVNPLIDIENKFFSIQNFF